LNITHVSRMCEKAVTRIISKVVQTAGFAESLHLRFLRDVVLKRSEIAP
jgi:hypothetical protein